MNTDEIQKATCAKVGSSFVPVDAHSKLGVALRTLHLLPLNVLRHAPEGETCGWFIWGGEDFSEQPEFFQPLHVAHMDTRCPLLVPYLGLAPGWRVLLAPEQEDVWYDASLSGSDGGA